jgi:hypothetical protein
LVINNTSTFIVSDFVAGFSPVDYSWIREGLRRMRLEILFSLGTNPDAQPPVQHREIVKTISHFTTQKLFTMPEFFNLEPTSKQ